MKRLILTTLAVSIVIGGLTTASASAATLTASPNSVSAGGTVTVSWSGVSSPTSADWIAWYLPSDPAQPGQPQFAWAYDDNCTQTAGSNALSSGSCTLPAPAAAGTYQIRLYANNNDTNLLATSGNVTVSSPSATISVSPTSIGAGGSVTVSWSGVSNPTSTDWMGWYLPSDPAQPGQPKWAWVYDDHCTQTSGSGALSSGSCTLTAPPTAGSYQMRLYANDNDTDLVATSGTVTVTGAAQGQGMAVPAYFYPGSYWTQMDQAGPALTLAVMNPNSGPGSAADPNYVSAVHAAQAAGITVVGYVYTDYGARSLSAVEADVNSYYSWYGVNGIFFDQASTNCSYSSYYATLNAFVKAKGGTARTILNPGTQTSQCYVSDADILLTFEGSDSQYVNSYSAPSWVASYSPSHFWHIIYGASTSSAMTQAVQLSKQRDAGFVYVTSGGLPNPYDLLPTGSYWTSELAAIG